jgi:hypothetical protein
MWRGYRSVVHRATAGERVAGAYAWSVVLLRAVVVVAWIAAAVAAWVALPALGGSSTAPLGDIVATDAQAIRAQERALELFGSTAGTDTAIVQRNPRGLSRRELDAHLRLAQRPPRGVRALVPVPNAQVGDVRWPERDTTVVTYLFMGPELNLVERDRAARAAARGSSRRPARARASPAPGRRACSSSRRSRTRCRSSRRRPCS